MQNCVGMGFTPWACLAEAALHLFYDHSEAEVKGLRIMLHTVWPMTHHAAMQDCGGVDLLRSSRVAAPIHLHPDLHQHGLPKICELPM